MKRATRTPHQPSIFTWLKCMTTVESKTKEVATASLKLSVAVARILPELIFAPILRLYKNMYSLIQMEITRMAIVTVLVSTGAGEIIFSIEDLPSSNPIKIITMATIKPEMYSIRPWPNGWSLSGSAPANLKPRRVIREEPASDRLLKASAITEIEPLIAPAKYLIPNKMTFSRIPTMPHSIP